MSAGACLRALFEFYGSSFPVEQQCVSVRTKGRPVLKVGALLTDLFNPYLMHCWRVTEDGWPDGRRRPVHCEPVRRNR